MRFSILGFLILVSFIFSWCSSVAQSVDVKIDLKTVKYNRIKVELNFDTVETDLLNYKFRSIQTGSFESVINNSLIKDFIALDAKGKRLPVIFDQDDLIIIRKANELKRIEYWVRDQSNEYDSFKPGANYFKQDKNFILNLNGIVGYFFEFPNLQYEIKIDKPKHLHAASSVLIEANGPEEDHLESLDYLSLLDHPLMYSMPDTISFVVDSCKFKIAVFSERGLVTSNQIYNYLFPLCKSVDDFISGIPVDEYQFIFYFGSMQKGGSNKAANYGALMHSHSSIYYLPESKNYNLMGKIVQRSAAHELLHMFIPFQLRSTLVSDQMTATGELSQHLWLYEGVTEYFSWLMRYRYGLISGGEYFDEMQEKMNRADKYPKQSLTKLSSNINKLANRPHFDNYYHYGALLAMALDIEIQTLTNQEKDLLSVLKALSKAYRDDAGFDDDYFFTKLTDYTHPDILEFCSTYIEGKKRIDYSEMLDQIGISYYKNHKVKSYSFGDVALDYDKNRSIFYFKNKYPNRFTADYGDQIVQVNGEILSEANADLLDLVMLPSDDKSINIQVVRMNKAINLSARPTVKTALIENDIEYDEDKFESQKKYFESWLKKEAYPN